MRETISQRFWRQDITGLRALAVLPVLIFHAFPNALPGGFFGVDIFFVISGYLISRIIFRGLERGEFSFVDFYSKRVKRIIPALIVVLAFVIAFGWAILFKEEFEEVVRYIFGSAFFFMNFRLISRENDYFKADAESLPLLHIWSLSVEEQFYLLFPLICFLIWRFFRKKEQVMGWFVFALTFASFLCCLFVKNDVYRFYFPAFRFWELGVGIVLAYIELFRRDLFCLFRQNLWLRNALSLVAFLAIASSILLYSPEGKVPGWMTLFPVCGAALLIVSESDALVNRTILSWRPFVFIGLISYSLYLWHWPLLCYFGLIFGESTVFWRSCVLLVAFAISILVYLTVEVPVRRSASRGVVPLLFLLLLLCALIPYAVRKGVLPPVWMDMNARLVNKPSMQEEQYPLSMVGGFSVPVSGDAPKPTMLIAGDSHAGMYFERAAKNAREGNKNIVMLYSGACFITDGYQEKLTKTENKCQEASKKFEGLLDSGEINVLILAQMWGNYEELRGDSVRVMKFKNTLNRFMDRGGKVFVLQDIPWTTDQSNDFDKRMVFRKNVIESGWVPWSEWRNKALNVPLPKEEYWKQGNEAMTKILPKRAQIIEVVDKVCPNGLCDLRAYRDDDHLLRGWARDNAYWLDAAFERKN